MAANTPIRSRSNPIIKRVGAIAAGIEPQTLVLEGDRLIGDAIAAGLALEVILVAEDRAQRAQELEHEGHEVRLVDAELLQRMSRLKTSPGILALCSAPTSKSIDELELDEDALLLVVAGVADPGNLGALARAAEAFGARALIIARGGVSPWSEKALRGSMGSLLRLSVCFGDEAQTIADALQRRGVRQAQAATRGGKSASQFDWKGKLALWIGAETGALPEVARDFEAVTIPMAGHVESLNVTVAAALLLYASGRVESRATRPAAEKKSRRG